MQNNPYQPPGNPPTLPSYDFHLSYFPSALFNLLCNLSSLPLSVLSYVYTQHREATELVDSGLVQKAGFEVWSAFDGWLASQMGEEPHKGDGMQGVPGK